MKNKTKYLAFQLIMMVCIILEISGIFVAASSLIDIIKAICGLQSILWFRHYVSLIIAIAMILIGYSGNKLIKYRKNN